MHARVARWTGARLEALDRAATGIDQQSSFAAPEGVPTKGLLVLTDRANGRVMAITFFETEEDMRKGDEVLNATEAPGEGSFSPDGSALSMGPGSVEFYEATTMTGAGSWAADWKSGRGPGRSSTSRRSESPDA